MKIRDHAFAAFAALAAAALLAAPARAIQNPDDVPAGDRLRRPNVSIDTETRLPDGGLLVKGSPAEVEIESLGQGKVKATFFQGGQRKGEAPGILVIKIPPAAPAGAGRRAGPVGKGPQRFADLGLDPNAPYSFVPGAGKVDFVIGNPGANQILIGLLLPAVQPAQALPPQPKTGAENPPPPDKQPRKPDTQEK